jgi:hypothetical protein
MQRWILAVPLVVSLVGVVKAQEATDSKTEEVKKEIMAIEQQKGAGLHKSVDATVQWFEKVNAPDMVYWYQDHNGMHLVTRDEVIAQFRSGERKVFGNTYTDYRVRVYGDGNAAVLTYRTKQNMEMAGKASTHESWDTDVYAKDNGVWRRVVHFTTFGPNQ